MHLSPERREDAHPPVTDLITETFDDDGVIIGDHSCRLALIADVIDYVAGRKRVEPVASGQPIDGLVGRKIADLTHKGAERFTQLDRSSRPITMPKGHLARLAGSGRDDDPFEGDVLDTPGRRTQQERLPGSRLIHHLFVELTNPGPVGKEHAIETAIVNRSGVRHGETLRARATTNRAADPIPHNAGP